MGESLGTPRAIIRYSGLFDFDGFYAAVIDWGKNHGYMWHEIDYKHKVPSPSGAEQEWKWRLMKDVNDFINYDIQFIIHAYDLLDVEVEVEGRKKNLTKGRLYIWINGTVTYDWQSKFGGGKFAKWLGAFYAKRMNPEIAGYWDTLYYRIWSLQTIIKKYFQMQTTKHPYKEYLKED
ncbi:hypothetical protein HOE37_05260 [Candidatus Woesearchaeota archaeon]|jgi:hypothetical protein|nr:hypothetical protein [Candidatus Woesearchaeota archaeon]MBT4111240.1 hypothetical protein [Candidatus Woesearchaeota archaeon]MBT4336820.1 hypothetical protein [Candidatus Woesearchaeota archaeon]MBT4469488.1 hypothetical protein [Candidatus Woesearchaeota archaeon]MBT6744117.1 hypothetical protein [Candidatus Woesearchaeota archaeon]